jgi:hypothetical protein
MPRVDRGAEVTLVVLVYRSLEWLDWCMEGVDSSKNDTRYRWCVVANDATEEVAADPRITVDFRNDDPSEFYINRVYRAWNDGVLNAPTQKVVMLNTDMYPADGWLDRLMVAKRANPMSVPTSLLVESGRVESAMPEYVKDFGKNPGEFDGQAFRDHARELRTADGKTEPGRLFMPILVDRQEFFDVGGYPEGNPPGTTGDKDLIRRYKEAGFEHVTALGSVVYHVQLGEQHWP